LATQRNNFQYNGGWSLSPASPLLRGVVPPLSQACFLVCRPPRPTPRFAHQRAEYRQNSTSDAGICTQAVARAHSVLAMDCGSNSPAFLETSWKPVVDHITLMSTRSEAHCMTSEIGCGRPLFPLLLLARNRPEKIVGLGPIFCFDPVLDPTPIRKPVAPRSFRSWSRSRAPL
jgi:hypothetical protein